MTRNRIANLVDAGAKFTIQPDAGQSFPVLISFFRDIGFSLAG
jgi:hypothetical protein